MATGLASMTNAFSRAPQFQLVHVGSNCLRASQVTLQHSRCRWAPKGTSWVVHASLSAAMPLSAKPDDLVDSILSKVEQTDRGLLLTRDAHEKVAEVADKLEQFCVDEPVKCPLIFGEL